MLDIALAQHSALLCLAGLAELVVLVRWRQLAVVG